MPHAQTVATEANKAFNVTTLSTATAKSSALANLAHPGGPHNKVLSTVCKNAGILSTDPGVEATQIAYLDTLPPGIQATLRAAFESAVSRDLPVQIVWMEGSPRLTISETATPATGGTIGGMSILLESPVS
jgi:hypothetical protein